MVAKCIVAKIFRSGTVLNIHFRELLVNAIYQFLANNSVISRTCQTLSQKKLIDLESTTEHVSSQNLECRKLCIFLETCSSGRLK